MNFSIISAKADQQTLIAQFSDSKLSTIRISDGWLTRQPRRMFSLCVLLMLLSASGLSAHSFPFHRMQSMSTESVHEASLSLGTTVSGSSYAEYQLQITSISGFEGCSGYAALSVDNQTLSFVLNNPTGVPLPANANVANVQVNDPSTGEQYDYLVTTDSGGVMIVIEDL